jgi:hypothetical protein
MSKQSAHFLCIEETRPTPIVYNPQIPPGMMLVPAPSYAPTHVYPMVNSFTQQTPTLPSMPSYQPPMMHKVTSFKNNRVAPPPSYPSYDSALPNRCNVTTIGIDCAMMNAVLLSSSSSDSIVGVVDERTSARIIFIKTDRSISSEQAKEEHRQ